MGELGMHDFSLFIVTFSFSSSSSQAEKKVEKIRQVCQVTSKKLSACMQSTGPDVEKRLVGLRLHVHTDNS